MSRGISNIYRYGRVHPGRSRRTNKHQTALSMFDTPKNTPKTHLYSRALQLRSPSHHHTHTASAIFMNRKPAGATSYVTRRSAARGRRLIAALAVWRSSKNSGAWKSGLSIAACMVRSVCWLLTATPSAIYRLSHKYTHIRIRIKVGYARFLK